MSFVAIAGSTLRRDDLRASVSLSNSLSGFSAARILPPMPVDKPNGTLLITPSGAGMHRQNTRRGANGEFPTGTIPLSSETYATEDRGFNIRVDKAIAAAYEDKMMMDVKAYEFAQAVVLREIEADVLTLINGATFGTTGASVAWTTYATAQPAADVAAAGEVLTRVHGITKDQLSLYLPGPVAEKLPFANDVIERMKIQTSVLPGSMSEAQLAQYFGIGEVIIGRSTSNTADFGQTATLAHMGTLTEGFLFVKSTGQPVPTLGIGRLPIWNADLSVADVQAEIEAFGVPIILEEWNVPGAGSTMYQARTYTKPFIFAATAGRRLTGLA